MYIFFSRNLNGQKMSSNLTEFIDFTIKYNQYISPTIFFFGFIGNILSIITFSGGILRKNPCGSYFFCLSITHLNNLIFGLLLNYLIDVHNIDLIIINIFICRIRLLILHGSVVLSSWLIVLAGIDRLCISSRNIKQRQFSNLKNARLSICLLILICFIFYCHILILFTIEQTKIGFSLLCTIRII